MPHVQRLLRGLHSTAPRLELHVRPCYPDPCGCVERSVLWVNLDRVLEVRNATLDVLRCTFTHLSVRSFRVLLYFLHHTVVLLDLFMLRVILERLAPVVQCHLMLPEGVVRRPTDLQCGEGVRLEFNGSPGVSHSLEHIAQLEASMCTV